MNKCISCDRTDTVKFFVCIKCYKYWVNRVGGLTKNDILEYNKTIIETSRKCERCKFISNGGYVNMCSLR